DPDPEWGDRFREPAVWEDPEGLRGLAAEAQERLAEGTLDKGPPTPLLTLLAKKLGQQEGEAEPLLRAAQRRHPEDFWLNYALGEALRERKPADAVSFYRAALATRPKVGAVHGEVGMALYRLDQFDEAILAYRRAIELDPKAVRYHIHLGICWQVQGQWEEAMAEFRRALEIDPNVASTHNNLGVCLKAKGRPDEAMAEFRRAIALDPNGALAHNQLAICLHSHGRLEEALAEYRRSIELDPQFSPSLYDAACAAIRAAAGQGPEEARPGEPERAGLRRQALDGLRAAMQLRTELLRGGKAVGWSLAAWQTDPALASVRNPEALAKLPDVERQQWQRLWEDVAGALAADPLDQGRAHAARREWAQAADCYVRALRLNPTDEGHSWFEYAAVRLLAGDREGYAKACARMVERCGKAPDLRPYHVARACTLAPDSVVDAAKLGRLAETELTNHAQEFWALTQQAALHYRAGRFAEAVPLLEQSHRADPRSGRAVLNWLWLALANQRLGKAEEARRWLGKAQALLDRYADGMPSGADEELGLHLHNWLEAHVLRREAEALLGSGPAKPK
ncbi:MAG TPA: tetratricopeptide repeat protein, partial [Gemmataceae bacterium]|nr:tetratricopeptide repeat protein [Gemmataceae bacterium]